VLVVSVAAAMYVLVGLVCYFYGFELIKKLGERRSRFGRWGVGGLAARSIFEPPHSRPIVFFFKGLGIFLVLAGVTFFLVMVHPPAPHR
jgi:hypothetical protein